MASPASDSIQEFKIQTSTYDASYGRNPGANVNVVTKSGTNSWHGTAFEFFRNAQLNANDFFYNRDNPNSQTTKQILNQNQFGGVIGGPVKKDKLFFFVSYQGTRSRNAVAPQGNSNGVHLSSNLPAGDLARSRFYGMTVNGKCQLRTIAPMPRYNPFLVNLGVPLPVMACNGSNISAVGLNILNLKNADGSYYIPSSGTNTFRLTNFSQPAIYQEDQVLINSDYLVNAKNSLAMRYFYTRNPQTVTLNGFLPGTPNFSYYANTAADARS